jgi:DNA-binding CsgD family transcriptional regulator
MSQLKGGFGSGLALKSSVGPGARYTRERAMYRSLPRDGSRSHDRSSDQAGTLAPDPGSKRSNPKSDDDPIDVNFASIVGLDAAGGWHILRVSLDGPVTADAAAAKVLRQFFSGDPGWAGGLPAPLAEIFFESRDWGTSRALSRNWRRFSVTKFGLKLTVHFVPDLEGGYIVLKTGPATVATDATALPVTDREQEVVTLVAAGKTNCEIGFLLHISARTVQKHMENIFRKLGVETRTALAMRAVASEFDRSS